ncbi:phosphoglycerate mutase family [Fusarium subglutinans]|uniref:Phosphoglycerate mutase family n=1 Tax=Gibberella subglutinans TaxID=42677 RepID=A0A8H5PJG4_GIBSU|nr:phosphoglycerate mutase family [Fusarium subglutinans]KAF5597458.1 phosphoglycerate mutase family [Fusarium subglutinans]
MPPVIHCIRHGQGFHNVGTGCYTLPDPRLTPMGEEHNMALREAACLLRSVKDISSLKGNSKCQPRIIAIPDAQETSDDPCDVGSDPSVLRKVVTESNWPVDLSLVKDGWNVKALGTSYSPESNAIAARARDARITIRQKIRQLIEQGQGDTDPQVALVTHGGFLHYFADDWEDSWLNPGTGWRNCETRSYVFEQDVMHDTDVEARITETTESRLRRGKSSHRPAKDEQAVLFEQAMDSWEKQGLQRPDRIGINVETSEIASVALNVHIVKK